MRTGSDGVTDASIEHLLTDEFMTQVYSVALAIIQSSMETAAQYAKAAGRDVVLTEDCVYGLKYQCRTFASAPDLEDRIRAMYETLSAEVADESENADDSEDADSETEFDEGEESEVSFETVDETTLPPFERAPDTDELAANVHAMVDTWDEWDPTDPAEYMFKRAVENVYITMAQTVSPKEDPATEQNM